MVYITPKHLCKVKLFTTCPYYVLLVYFQISLLIFRERDKEREKEKCQCERETPPAHTPTGDWTRNPRHVSWPRIKPMTVCCTGQHSTKWANLDRAMFYSCYREKVKDMLRLGFVCLPPSEKIYTSLGGFCFVGFFFFFITMQLSLATKSEDK